MTGSFLQEPPMSPQVQALYDEDLADGGYVWNGSRLWAYQPDTLDRLFEAMSLVGGYFGGRLAQAGADVHFIARGALLQALREHGPTVRSVKGDFHVQAPATDDPADVGRCDFVLFCVKAFDTDAAAAGLGP